MRFILLISSFYLTAAVEVPSLTDGEKTAMLNILVARERGDSLVVEETTRQKLVLTVRSAVSNKLDTDISALGQEAEALATEINNKGLNSETAFKALVVQNVFEANKLKFSLNPASSFSEQAFVQLKNLEAVLHAKAQK
jgi:hypothetical protein